MLIGQGHDWREGLDGAWETLADLNPEQVCKNTLASFDTDTGHYILPVYNKNFFVSPSQRTILGNSGVAEMVLNELPHYSILSALWYLINAADVEPTGRLVNPGEVKGGMIFSKGAHQLPLEKLVEKYGSDAAAMVDKGIELGGEQLDFADAAVMIYPFPKLPMALLLWQQDDEFPPRADILFDSTCTDHLPTDILWATAMMSILVM